jgi:hypothetical protein
MKVGTNAAMNSLQLHLSVSTTTAISMLASSSYSGSYVSFRFKIVNYEFTCSGFIRFRVTYRQPGIGYSSTTEHAGHTQMVTCLNDN